MLVACGAMAAWALASRWSATPGWWTLPLTTLGWAVGIGVLATMMAWPAAWVIRARGWGAAAWMLAPMLMPSYLCYAAYGLVRAPGTVVGDWIESAAQAGATWLPALAGRCIAVVGLSLWAWPLAAVALGLGLRRVDQRVLDALALEPGGAAGRAWRVLRLTRGTWWSAVGLVGLIMLGSAVPLHLANAPTFAVRVWFELTMNPGGGGAWRSAWPLVVAAMCGAGLLTVRALRAPDAPMAPPASEHPVARAGAILVAGFGTVVPWLLLAWSIRDWTSVRTFWSVSGESVRVSLVVGAGAGLGVAGLCVLAWAARSMSEASLVNTIARVVTFVFIAAGLLPGVLTGAVIARVLNAWDMLRPIADGPLAMVVGCVVRYGWIGVLVGTWLAWSEGRRQREARTIDGLGGLLGWYAVCVPGRWGAVIGVFAAGCALGLHEIEAAVVLQPPGTPGLSQTLLGDLHFARSEEFAAAGVQIVGAGMALGVVWGACVGRVGKRVAG